MLGDHPIGVILLATDLQASRTLYAQKVGLKIVSETDNAVTFQCGGHTRLTVSASTTGTADEQTQASWRVENLAAELAELRSRGVEIAATVGHSDRTGLDESAPMKSWNSSHPSRGCSQEALRSTGGNGLYECFATD